ncbi:MAG: hypothetical protein KDC80_03460 [Saprospiraceae bacterium]|nr:hypothetical protein [Saprospiraceae bacterium]
MSCSLVSYYGRKNQSLHTLFHLLQEEIYGYLGNAFHPYLIEQIHGTIIGLEIERCDDQYFSKWCIHNREDKPPVNLNGLSTYLQKDIPIKFLKFGGFLREEKYGFRSWGMHPFERSFSIRGNTLVLNGWPVVKQDGRWEVNPILYEWRSGLESFSFCHKWHVDGNKDNDLFMVLGRFDKDAVEFGNVERLKMHLQEYLAQNELIIPMTRDDVKLVRYKDTELRPSSTRVHPLSADLVTIIPE